MGYYIQSATVYQDVYETLCGIIKEDETIKPLVNGVLFDFDLVDSSFVHTPAQPRNVPRIYLLPVSVQYPIESTCNGSLTIEYNVVVDGFHFRDVRLSRLACRLMFLLRYIPFTSLKIGDNLFPVICTVGSGSFEYDAESQVMTHVLSLTVEVKV